ncbi:MAG: hypothetical protein V2I54_09095 [Bacteroidales bacterium]|jgi:hypothetical protein|nr:hypothetical protein [Bacteroidales bacterium]
MNYEKLTILPCQDPGVSQKILKALIYEEAYILLVVLGTGSEAQQILELGTKAAGNAKDPGMVVWITDPQVVSGVLSKLNDPDDLLNDLSSVSAFALSISDRVVDVIHRNESPIDILRVWELFMKGLKD